MGTKLMHYARLVRLHKPIGILLLLWPTLWALLIASNGRPDIKILLIFIAGVILMRSAGCAINDFADRKIDAHITRTKNRPLAMQQIQPQEAVRVFLILSLLAFALVLFLNRYTIILSFIAVGLAAVYPFTKRVTHLPQLVLGAAYGFGVPMAFAAQTNHIPNIAWLLYIATILWPVAYDTLYAMTDRADDLLIGVKSTAILFGNYDRVLVGLLHAIVIALLFSIGRHLQFGLAYNLSLLLATACAIYQQYLIHKREPQQCFAAFLNNNWFGLIILLGIIVEYIPHI